MKTNAKLDKIAGVPCEITFRDDAGLKMTFSFEGKNSDALNRLENAFSNFAEKIVKEYDEECDLSLVWVDFKKTWTAQI
jgi:hypothetical protein